MKMLFSFFVICAFSCTPSGKSSLTIDYADNLISYALEQKIHVEVEPLGELSQVFYWVDARDLATGLIMRPKVQVQGRTIDAQRYISNDNMLDNRDNMACFSDIIALPKANNVHFLSPRMPATSESLSPDQDFKADLLAGLSYALILNPNGLYGRPPFYYNWEQQPEKSELLFNMSEFGKFISGYIKYHGAQKDKYQLKITQAHRLVSSVALLKHSGHFFVELSKELFLGNDVDVNLIIEPQDPESTLPRFTKSYSVAELLAKPDLGLIDLGALPNPIDINISLAGPGFIYLKGRVGMGYATIKKALSLSGPTLFEGLYPGIYEIAMIPPSDSPWAMRVLPNILIEPDLDIILKWHKREVLDAQVVDANENIVSGAHIEFSRVAKLGSFSTEDIFVDQIFPFTALSNDKGLVCHQSSGNSSTKTNECQKLGLDEGRYIAHIIPPAGAPFAHLWQSFDFPTTQNLKFKLESTQKLSGKILRSDQKTPIKQAFITIYAIDSTALGQPKILAHALTDAQGHFQTFIPAL